MIAKKSPVRGDAPSPTKHTGRDRKDGARGGTQRYTLPHPVEVGRRDRFFPRRRSLWFKPQKSTQDEPDRTIRGWDDPLSAVGDPDANSLRNSWRHSNRSVASSGDGSITGPHDSWPQSGRSSNRLSLRSNGSTSSSLLTRFSGSTLSTLLTAPSSGTTSWRSSRGSVLQREKRFSNANCKSHADSLADKT